MKRSQLIVGALALAFLVSSLCAAEEAMEKGNIRALAQGNNAFALDLYAELKGEDGNLFFSPFSISTALAMTYAGARGETAAQMKKTLHLPDDPHAAFKAFDEDLMRRADLKAKREGRHFPRDQKKHFEPLKLVTANALWGQKGYGFLPAFLTLTKENYGAGLHEMDFGGDAEGARKTINKWVEQKTQDKIKDLIPRGGVNAATRLVLTNAIYFKASWKEPFQQRATKDAPFALLDGKKVNVPTMRKTHRFGYMENDTLQALELEYRACDLTMVILLPRKADGVTALEKQLTQENLNGWLKQLKRGKKVRLELPKFRFSFGARMRKLLVSLGMTDAFAAGKANFSGMNGGKEPLWIDAVIHKAFVDVNEKGTEAAAATAVMMAGAAPRPEEPVPFLCDHPFLFLIRDRVSGSILFMGRVANPQD